MIIGAGQQVCFPFLYPFFPLMTLALWAMAVAATIIAYADVATAITGIYMATQSCCATVFDGSQSLLLMNR
jgi:hypothetical protein